MSGCLKTFDNNCVECDWYEGEENWEECTYWEYCAHPDSREDDSGRVTICPLTQKKGGYMSDGMKRKVIIDGVEYDPVGEVVIEPHRIRFTLCGQGLDLEGQKILIYHFGNTVIYRKAALLTYASLERSGAVFECYEFTTD